MNDQQLADAIEREMYGQPPPESHAGLLQAERELRQMRSERAQQKNHSERWQQERRP